MKDAFTGADINIPADAATRQKVFLSEALAALLKNGCDRAKVYSHDKSSYEIAGVFQDYKHRNYEQPYWFIGGNIKRDKKDI